VPTTPSVAIAFEPEHLDLRHRETLRGIARYARQQGWRLAIDPYADRRRPMPFDGVIATTRKGRGPGLADAPVPVVVVSWGLVQFRLNRVIENRYAAGRVAARHFEDQGCRTFGYIGFTEETASRIEREHFTKELARRGRGVERARTFVSWARTRGSWAKVMRSLGSWLERLERPAGLFVARPDFARAIVDVALARGLRIPQDIAVVAADDDPVLCALAPALTAVRFDYAAVGRRAAELLESLMQGGRPPRRSVLIPPALVPRYSTDLQAIGDPLVDRALVWIARHCTERFDWRVLRRGEGDRICPHHVAEALGVSQRALNRRLRRAGRGSISDELTVARLDYAKLDLEGGNVPVAAAAHESGFGSYSSFLRAFRKHVGMSPAAWRRQHGYVAAAPPERRVRLGRGR